MTQFETNDFSNQKIGGTMQNPTTPDTDVSGVTFEERRRTISTFHRGGFITHFFIKAGLAKNEKIANIILVFLFVIVTFTTFKILSNYEQSVAPQNINRGAL